MVSSRDQLRDTEMSAVSANNEALSEDMVNNDVPPLKGPDIIYGIDEVPPWYMVILLSLQQYLQMFATTIAIPLIVTETMCIEEDQVGRSEVIGTILFSSGIVTFLQATVGSRLPIVQGESAAFLSSTFAILSLPRWACPAGPGDEFLNATINMTLADSDPLLRDWRREVWTSRLRLVQGGVLTSGLFEMAIGFSGVLGFLLRYIGPLSIAPTVCLVGLSVVAKAAEYSSAQWGIACMTVLLITIFAQHLRNVGIPPSKCGRGVNSTHRAFYLFKFFPIIMAIVISWLVCFILTVTNVFPEQPDQGGYKARTDIKLDVLRQAKWFRFPYPAQWGLPVFDVAAIFGMFAAVLASSVESVGDYHACARLAGVPAPPVHAVNRGLMTEGFGNVVAGLLGTTSGVTSYSGNVMAVGLTKVASRRVIQGAAAFMVFFGLFAKFGALFVTIPTPIIGGYLMSMFGMIFAVGVSNLQLVDLNSSRNLYIFGLSIFLGLCVPLWMTATPGAIQTGSTEVDQILTVLLSTGMFVGGAVGMLLDNTVPGTLEERGMAEWRHQHVITNVGRETNRPTSTYDFPIGMNLLQRCSLARFLPVCPTFLGFQWSSCRSEEPVPQAEMSSATASLNSSVPKNFLGARPSHTHV